MLSKYKDIRKFEIFYIMSFYFLSGLGKSR